MVEFRSVVEAITLVSDQTGHLRSPWAGQAHEKPLRIDVDQSAWCLSVYNKTRAARLRNGAAQVPRKRGGGDED